MQGKLSTNYQKYRSANPLRRLMIKRFKTRIEEITAGIKPKSILDAGCGEGFTISYLHDLLPETIFTGIDMSNEAIETAKQRNSYSSLQTGSVYALPFSDNSFDLVICSEVLEHLKEPESALRELGRVSKKYLLLSVPNEPLFRISSFLSGKYLKTWGNHPEHIQNWSKAAFIALIKRYFHIIKADASFPWTIILAEKS